MEHLGIPPVTEEVRAPFRAKRIRGNSNAGIP